MIGGIGKRYAKAFLSITIEEKIVDRVGDELNHLARVLQENKSLQLVVLNPGFSLEDRFEIIKVIGKKLKTSETVLKFCRFLLTKNRLFYLPAISKAYQYFADLHSGRLRAVVTSAKEIERENLEQLTRSLKSELKRDIVVDTQISPELIGGVVTKIGGIVIDGSIRNYLEQVRKEMK